uniref:KASH domain-containing protein n=1 Tax=Stegastes partitus TaxID=144197 RepID=A0A3B4ZFM6_9TELE
MNLQAQMTEFEASAEPLQDWLNITEVRVQESSARLHDLPAKRQELSKLQVSFMDLCASSDCVYCHSCSNRLCTRTV